MTVEPFVKDIEEHCGGRLMPLADAATFGRRAIGKSLSSI
jgi:hypothetical protein